ncbi:MAG: T9SS type A sorting domain-containing protein [Calditrichaeota bacterium]|nr:T9SS type A sorting domain-containing protein [Calditrichota bacterium]
MRWLTLVLIMLCVQSGISQDFRSIQESREHIRQMESARRQKQIQVLSKISTPNQLNYDVTGYTINLNIWPVNKTIDGSVVITGKSKITGLTHLEFNLFSNMTVDSITQNGSPLTFNHAGNLVDVQLPAFLGTDGDFSVEIFYHGNPQSIGLGSWRWSTHSGNPIISTLSEPFGAPTWWPCKDDPADKADSVFLNITVPENLVVASNGLLKAVTPAPDNRHTYSWETRYPISNYLVSLAISNYAEFNDWYVSASGDSMPLVYYVYPEHLAAAQEDFSVTDEMISAFAEIYGEYPFIEEKYGMAIFSWGGAMEHQTMTSYGSGLITGNHTYDWINAHELAHQWFGDLITMKRWSHIWLNEGFASYSEAMWMESLYGKTAYHNYLASQDPGFFSGSLFVTDSTNENALFSNTVYDKGSWALHMLRGVLGDSLFFAGIRSYATDSSLVFGNATTEDFRDICEAVSGMDLDWYFDEWVYRAGRPNYQYDWKVTGNRPFTTTLTLKQTNAVPYKMPIQIYLFGDGLDSTVTVWDSLAYQQFQFVTNDAPIDVQVDPDNWILKNIDRVTGIVDGENEQPQRFELTQNYPNPFNPTTTIEFYLQNPGYTTLAIYDMLGQKIATLAAENLNSGRHLYQWDASGMASGIYYYRLTAGNFTAVKKALLLR